jgi:hypothetical protein
MTDGDNDTDTNMTDGTDSGLDDLAGDTDPTTDTEHHLGGLAAALAGVEVRTVPEAPGRFTVDTLPVERADPPAVVDVGFYTDGVSGRAFLKPVQARTLTDQDSTETRPERIQQG